LKTGAGSMPSACSALWMICDQLAMVVYITLIPYELSS
jgi:hypothetical protein